MRQFRDTARADRAKLITLNNLRALLWRVKPIHWFILVTEKKMVSPPTMEFICYYVIECPCDNLRS